MTGVTKVCGTDGTPITNTKKPGELALDVSISNPSSAFGEMSTVELSPKIQFDAVYGLRTLEDVEVFTAEDGTATVERDTLGSQFVCQSGTTITSYGLIRSKKDVRYRPGQGIVLRWSALFSTATALGLQRAGGITLGNELTIGYTGPDFGCLLRNGGKPEIQYLDISTATGNQTLTINLDGTSFSVSTTGSDPTTTAAQIADASFTGWVSTQNDSRVTFQAQAVGDKTGAFNVTTTGTFTGVFTEKQAGHAHVDTFITQSSWNIDKVDGSEGTTFTLDPLKGNVYQVKYQYLGYGAVTFSVGDPNTGKLTDVHQIQYMNDQVQPSMDIPIFKVGWLCANSGNTTNMTVKGASAAGFVEGSIAPMRNPVGHISTANVGTTLTNVLMIRVRPEFNGRVNITEVFPDLLTYAVDGTKPAEVEIYINPDIASATSWTYHKETESIVDYSESGVQISGSNEVITAGVAKAGDGAIDLSEYNVRLSRMDILSVAVRATSGTTDATVGLTWTED
jgi:hypothetical protein